MENYSEGQREFEILFKICIQHDRVAEIWNRIGTW